MRAIEKRTQYSDRISNKIEEIMNEEARHIFASGFSEDFTMTNAEMEYLTAMEKVKSISKQLVVAEKGFKLVGNRIEKLVAQYEALLMEDDESGSYTGSEASTYESEEENDQENEMLARRAQKAELRAEVAAREAMLAKEEAIKLKEEKQRELDRLQKRLAELENKSMIEKQRSDTIIRGTNARTTSFLPHSLFGLLACHKVLCQYQNFKVKLSHITKSKISYLLKKKKAK
eukprot:713756_1